MVGVDASSVAVGSQVSVFAGLLTASLPADAEVLTTAGDFTSVVFAFYAQVGSRRDRPRSTAGSAA